MEKIFVIPFIMGAIGYVLAGEKFMNSLYASMALYFVNPVSDEYNILIEIARWTAPLATATTILRMFRDAWDVIQCRFCLWGQGDKVAVYSDEQIEFYLKKEQK